MHTTIAPLPDDVIIHNLGSHAWRGRLRETFSITDARCAQSLYFDRSLAEDAGRSLAAERAVALWFEGVDRRLALLTPRHR